MTQDPSPLKAPERIPLKAIKTRLLNTRDRTSMNTGALQELKASIRATGLRTPIEIMPYPGPTEYDYALISGFRRLTAYKQLWEEEGGADDAPHATIPAVVRNELDPHSWLFHMVAENSVREDITPWDQGRIAVEAADFGFYPCVESAVEGLHPHADRRKKAKIKKIARMVDEMDGALQFAEQLTERQCLRLTEAVEAGFGDIIRTALKNLSNHGGPGREWQMILPYVQEAEMLSAREKPITDRPIRMVRPRKDLVIRREVTPDGYCLIISGRDARVRQIDDLMIEAKRMFSTVGLFKE